MGNAMREIDPEILRLARTRRGPYLAALNAPRNKLSGLLAVLALDGELARIADTVSEPMLGRIRLQWWLDALDGPAGAHPVLAALAPLGVDVAALRHLVDLRSFDLDEGPATDEAWRAHALAMGGARQGLMLDVLGVHDASTREAAQFIGAAWTLVQAAHIRPRGLTDGQAENLRDQARNWLKQARTKPADKAGLPALLLARLVERRLNAPDAPLGAGAVLSVWWGNLSGRF